MLKLFLNHKVAPIVEHICWIQNNMAHSCRAERFAWLYHANPELRMETCDCSFSAVRFRLDKVKARKKRVHFRRDKWIYHHQRGGCGGGGSSHQRPNWISVCVQIMISKPEDDWWKTFRVVYMILQTKPKNRMMGARCVAYNCARNFLCIFLSLALSLGAELILLWFFGEVKLIHCVVVGGQFIVYFLTRIRTHHICSVHSILWLSVKFSEHKLRIRALIVKEAIGQTDDYWPTFRDMCGLRLDVKPLAHRLSTDR